MIAAASVRWSSVESAGHLAAEPGADVLDLGLAQLRPLRGVEDTRRLGADGGPLLGRQREQRQAGRVGDPLERRPEQRRPLLGGVSVGEGLVDRPDALVEQPELVLGDGDRRAPS